MDGSFSSGFSLLVFEIIASTSGQLIPTITACKEYVWQHENLLFHDA
jgi:hypothetical protein